MSAIITTSMRVYSANQFLTGLANGQSNLYTFISRTLPWPVDSNPPAPVDSVAERAAAVREMISAKRINAADLATVAPRNNWTSGTIYTPYSDAINIFDPTQVTTPFFVVNSSLSVYKCLSNGNGAASTIQPINTSTNKFTLSDGYVWKYMFTVNTGDVLNFVTSNWIPVRTLTVDDGSTQWQVQQAAIPGTVDRIIVNASGTQYTSAPTVRIVGDGSGATAAATVANGNVTAINVTNSGSNYTYATVQITGGGGQAAGASATAVLSPLAGHGADPQTELGAFNVMINGNLINSESGSFTVSNDYRRIGVIANPLLTGTTTVASATDISQTTSLTLSNITGTTFVNDEVVTGSISGATGYMLDWNSTTGVLRLVQVSGTFQPSEGISGANVTGLLQSLSDRIVSATSNGAILPNTASTTDGAYTGATITITGGTGVGQSATITGYAGLTRQVSVSPSWNTLPNSTSTFVISFISLPQLNASSGNVLYLENRQPILRAANQTENIRIIIIN